ncbi:sensor histidine kinase [Cupriavidus sp. AU9028]|nr:sensor histidine kinase [Cupriavidus sp. AU9028]
MEESEADVDTATEVVALIDQISHDLRSALNGVQSWAYVLDQSLDTPPAPAQRALSGLRTAMQQQVVLIQHLEESVRLLADDSKPQWQPVNLAATLAEAIESVRPLAQARRVELAEVIDRDPGGSSNLVIQADPRRLEPMLRHLLLHCLKQVRTGDTIVAHLLASAEEVKLRITESRASTERVRERLHALTGFFRREPASGGSQPRQSSALLLTRRLSELHGAALVAEDDCPDLAGAEQASACISIVFPRNPADDA